MIDSNFKLAKGRSHETKSMLETGASLYPGLFSGLCGFECTVCGCSGSPSVLTPDLFELFVDCIFVLLRIDSFLGSYFGARTAICAAMAV